MGCMAVRVAQGAGAFSAMILLLASSTLAFTAISRLSRTDTSLAALTVPGMWGSGLNFGKGEFKFYKSFDSFMKPFPEEDREAFPEIFNIPKGVYEISMTKPLQSTSELISTPSR